MPYLQYYFNQPPLQVSNPATLSASNIATSLDPSWLILNNHFFYNEFIYTSMPTFNPQPKPPGIDDKAMADKHVECGLDSLVKEAHQERLNSLRGLLKEIADDEWKYGNSI